jgi:hypothetical protein
MKKFNQYIIESSSSLEVRESEFYVIMFEKSNMVPTGLIEELKKGLSKAINDWNPIHNREYIRDFVSGELRATENLDSLDTFELIEVGFQSKEDVRKYYDYINRQIERVSELDIKYGEELKKYEGKLIIRKFITIAQSATGNLNF